ncbi:hypothetical protein ACWLMY_35505 [Streptomyces anulatus]
MGDEDQQPRSQPLLTLRTVIVLLLGCLTGAAAGALTVAADGSTAEGVLAGGVGFAGAVLFFHAIIAP